MAGTVMVIYASMLGPIIPDAAAHIVIASVISAPAAMVISCSWCRNGRAGDRRRWRRAGGVGQHGRDHAGHVAGIELLLKIVAMLVVLVALVYLVNAMLGLLPDVGGRRSPCSACWASARRWLADGRAMEPGADRRRLIGIKTILNELIAYLDLSHSARTLSLRSG